MLLAHLDTVYIKLVRTICKSKDKNVLMSPQGIGGDDRCGVYILVKTYELFNKKPGSCLPVTRRPADLAQAPFVKRIEV